VDNENVVMFITDVDIRDPDSGYTAPLDTSLFYVLHDPPSLELFLKHNSMTKEKYDAMFSHMSTVERQKYNSPVLFASCKLRRDTFKEKKPLFSLPAPCPVGKWILLKMLNAFRSVKINIDILYFGVEGFLLDLKTGEISDFSTRTMKQNVPVQNKDDEGEVEDENEDKGFSLFGE